MKKIGWMVSILFLGSACGAHDLDAGSSEVIEDADVAELSQMLNSSGTCPTATPNRTYTGSLPYPRFIGPSSYGVIGCTAAYFVNIDDLTTSASDEWAYRDFIVPASAPTTQSVCNRSRLMVYVWERTSSGVSFKGSRSYWGLWVDSPTGDACLIQSDLVTDFPTVVGRDYHLAVSSRLYAVAHDATSSFSMNRILFEGPYEP